MSGTSLDVDTGVISTFSFNNRKTPEIGQIGQRPTGIFVEENPSNTQMTNDATLESDNARWLYLDEN